MNIKAIFFDIGGRASDFPEELRAGATSLRRELRRKANRLELVRSFLLYFEREYTLYLKHRLRRSLGRIRKYSALLGREVTLHSGRSRITGLAKDVIAEKAMGLRVSVDDVTHRQAERA